MIDKKVIVLKKDSKQTEIAFSFCFPGQYRISNRLKLAAKNAIVKYSKPYWLQETTVSLGLYEFVYGKRYYEDGLVQSDRQLFPWYGIDFKQVQDFLTRLNSIVVANQVEYHLDIPTITEWEHALYCNRDKTWSWGDDDQELKDYAWFKDNSGNNVHLARQKNCNEWGLYDMYGNVHEYCYHSLLNFDKSIFVDPEIDKSLSHRVLPAMGGAYCSSVDECSRFNILGIENEYIEPVGIRLILR